jgi:poly-gamma-glutamate synthesis protein (capsule biosynthesis protein)
MLGRNVADKISRSGTRCLFAGVTKIFKLSNFSLINLECPLTDDSNPVKKEFVFEAPCSLAIELKKAGITLANLANNHSFDHQKQGLSNTLKALNTENILPIGISNQPYHIQFKRNRLAIFGANLVTEESQLENGKFIYQPFESALIENITDYHKNYPGDIIILTLHWGFEYREFPTSTQQGLAYKLIDAGAKVIAGHHPHVLQPIEFYKDGVIFYSLGNLVFDQSSPVTRQSMVISVNFLSGTINSIAIYPMLIERYVPRPCTKQEWGELEIIGKNDKIELAFAKF